jgi:hypothetical protein
MASGFQNTNAFQNAGQYGSFTYYERGNAAVNNMILFLLLVLLFALLRSEARNRALLRQVLALSGGRSGRMRVR